MAVKDVVFKVLMYSMMVIMFGCFIFGMAIVGSNLKLGALLVLAPLVLLFYLTEHEDGEQEE